MEYNLLDNATASRLHVSVSSARGAGGSRGWGGRMAARILIADHHAEDGEALAAFLTRQGLGTECWNAGDALLQRLAVQPPALVLLHRRVRTEPDLTVLRRLR